MKKAFTFIELIIVIAIFLALTTFSLSAFFRFRRESALTNNAEEIIGALRMAQNRTLISKNLSRYGVYFKTTVSPHQYILFQGESYALRNDSFDETYEISSDVKIFEIDLAGGSEVVFNRLTGTTSQSGAISLRLDKDHSKTKIIHIKDSGQVSLVDFPVVSDAERIKDSRHVHFNYSRIIDTTNETITLTFSGSTPVTEEIVLVDNLSDGQIYWEGAVNVDGDNQYLKVHTHRLNNLDTQFCIHRETDENNKALVITISGDGSGSLVEYSADGSVTIFPSIFCDNSQWQ